MFRELLSSRKHSLLYDAIDEVLNMVEKAERMYQEASTGLLDGAPEPDIAREDQDINTGERLVRRLIFEHLLIAPQQERSWKSARSKTSSCRACALRCS